MLSVVRSRTQGNSKEPRTRPAPKKSPCKKKIQTFSQTLEKARELLQEAAPSRVRIVVNDKKIVRAWTSKELDVLLIKGHLVHRSRELSHLSPHDVRRLCVKELLKESFLVRDRFGEYKVASEQIAQAS